MQYFPSGRSKGITCWEKRASYTYFLILPWGEEKKKKDTSTGNWRRVSPLGSYSSCASGTLPWEICHHPIWEIHYHPIIERNATTLLNGRSIPAPYQRNNLFPPYHLRNMPPLYQKKYTTTPSVRDVRHRRILEGITIPPIEKIFHHLIWEMHYHPTYRWNIPSSYWKKTHRILRAPLRDMPSPN